MKTRFLLPNKFKTIGLIAMLISTIIFLVVLLFDEQISVNYPVFVIWSLGNSGHPTLLNFEKHDILSTISGILLLLSMILVAFSSENNEDEYITKLRLESLIWAVYINCVFLLFCFLFFYGWPFALMMVFNMYSILLLFIVRFNFQLYKSKRMLENAK